MLYLDNAATSRFKPQTVIDAINYDLRHSANSGRSGHDDAINAGLKIENCRQYLKSMLGASNDCKPRDYTDTYNIANNATVNCNNQNLDTANNNGEQYDVVFTKNCTEALNLAIFGSIKGGEHVLTSTNEHNSVLRPLYELERRGMITLDVLDTKGKRIDLSELAKRAVGKDVIVLGGACNVTGATLNLYEVGKIAKQNNAKLIVDGAQCVPIMPVNLREQNIDMLACAGHKGLHGMQGTGFLIFKKNIELTPLLYGGTGTFSASVLQPSESPDGLEAGTLFAGGISALHEGAKWSFKNADATRISYAKLTKTALYNLKSLGCTLYSDEYTTGVISFNIGETDSSFIAEKLNEFGIAVRSGLHCAPLVHKALGTINQGAVRVSFGVETTLKDVNYLSNALEKIIKKL